MSQSPENEKRIKLTVTTSDAATEIFVLDDRFSLARRGVGTLEANLDPGIYKVKVRAGHATEEQLVSLEPESAGEHVTFPPLKFCTPAPLEHSTTTSPALQEAAEQQSSRVHDSRGSGSRVFVFIHACSELGGAGDPGPIPENLADGLSLFEADGLTQVSDFAARAVTRPHAWAACNVELDPKVYRLRLRLPSGHAIDQTIAAPAGWQAQVFLTLRAYNGSPEQRADLATAAHMLTWLPEGGAGPVFRHDSVSARVTELARTGLAFERPILSESLINQFLDETCDDPMLGIFVAHLMVLGYPMADQSFGTRDRALRQLAADEGTPQELSSRLTKNPLDQEALDALARLAGADPRTPLGSVLDSLRAFGEGIRKLPTLGNIIQKLRRLLGEGTHPDVAALGAYFRHAAELARRLTNAGTVDAIDALGPLLGPDAALSAFLTPPMLRRSWSLVLGLSVDRPEIVPSGSLSAQAAPAIWGPEPWLLWLSAGEAAAFEPIRAGVVEQYRKLQAARFAGARPLSFSTSIRGFEEAARGPTATAEGKALDASAGEPDMSLIRELVRNTGLPSSSLKEILDRGSAEAMASPARSFGVQDAWQAVTGFVQSVFSSRAQHLFWRRLDDARVVPGPGSTFRAEEIVKDQAYFVIRLKEMYVRDARRLWQEYYPVLHSFIDHQKVTEQTVVGPGQLVALGNAGIQRIVSLNQRLAGPTVYRGGDLNLVVGLYSVPGGDVARALIDTVGEITKLGGIALGQVPKIADAVKGGIERTLGLKDTRLQFGVQSSFPAGTAPSTGLYVGIAADERDVDVDQLWLGGGRLRVGSATGPPFEQADYLVVALERLDARDDWPLLPGLPEIEAKFAAILSDGAFSVEDKKKKINELWGTFATALDGSPYLTSPDRARIKRDVTADLQSRVDPPRPFAAPADRGAAPDSSRREEAGSFAFDRVARLAETEGSERGGRPEVDPVVPPFPPESGG